ncbi:MAG: hypothetical protein LBI68_01895, partial [Azoarcus sp.]|nr:hypothetical protein [Azoarcus sp.]
PHKTIRYWEGGIKKVERAQQLGEYCRRTVIRTLRGGLMIVPAEHENAANTAMKDCRREAFPVVMR